MTALARFSCRVRVARSRAARLTEYAHTARHDRSCTAGSHTGSARLVTSLTEAALVVATRGVMVSMICPSVNASPCHRK